MSAVYFKLGVILLKCVKEVIDLALKEYLDSQNSVVN